MKSNSDKYLALSGGIGGAKLALGLYHCLQKSQLNLIVNTGDDFEHMGLMISPDIDTLLYTLADLNNLELGWGRRDESWHFTETCEQMGMDSWFRLGDRDLAIHIYRTQALRQGLSLSQVVDKLIQCFALKCKIVPMSDMPVRTMIECEQGTLSFQEYFVKNRCQPEVSNIYYSGIKAAKPAQAFLDCLKDKNLRAIIICPSNPFLSIQPILALPSIKQEIKNSGKPVIVVSPIVSGQSIKGPTAKLMREMKLECSVRTVAELYRDIASVIIIDKTDAASKEEISSLGLSVVSENIIMNDLQDKIDLAQTVIDIVNDV